MKKPILTLLAWCLCALPIFAQNFNTAYLTTKIDAQKTANSKDILTTLFRASIDNLLGDDRTYTLNSSFLGFHEIINKKKPLPYSVERKLKQNSFNLGLTGDEEHNITKVSGGFTLTIKNDKDITENKIAPEFAKLRSYAAMISPLLREVRSYLVNAHPLLKNDAVKMQEIIGTWNEASRQHDFSILDNEIKKALKSSTLQQRFLDVNKSFSKEEVETLIAAILNGDDILYDEYQHIANVYAKKLLWTVSPSASYDRIHKQGEYLIATNATFGLWKKSAQKPWEFEMKAQFKIANDSTLVQSNYNDKPLSISIGLNKVLLQNQEKESKMEFKFFTQYNLQLGATPSLQEKDVFTLNATLRVNVYKSLWLPVTLKYDAAKGNLLGLFTLTANLSK